MDLGPYLKFVSPPRSGLLHEMRMNSVSHHGNQVWNQENDGNFCDSSNVDECLDYLDKELQILGFKSLYNQEGQFSLVSLVNTVHSLLRKYQRSSRYREELESRVHRSGSDLEHLQSSHKKLRLTNESLQNDVAKSEENERRLQLDNSNLKSRLKTHSEEIRRLKAQIQSNENQYKHEVKKKEKQLMVIKEKAQQLMTDKWRTTPAGSGLEISYCLQRADGKRSKWRNEASSNRNEEDMYQAVIGNYERRCTTLLSENNKLRDMVTGVLNELSDLSSHETSRSPHKDQLQLPIDMIEQRVVEALRNSCDLLRQKTETLSKSSNEGLNSTSVIDGDSMLDTQVKSKDGADSNGGFRDSIESYKSVIEKQNKIIEAFENQESCTNIDLSILEEQESLTKDKAKFYKQKAQLEQDKHTLVEAARNLRKERQKLEEYRRKLMNDSSGLLGAELNKSFSPRRSPRPERISQHIENVKIAVEERQCPGYDNQN